MTANKHFKHRVRERMKVTGESYTVARAHVERIRPVSATERVKFKCTCGAEASVAKTAEGGDMILHANPPCEAYLRDRDPGEYLMECRKAMEGKKRS